MAQPVGRHLTDRQRTAAEHAWYLKGRRRRLDEIRHSVKHAIPAADLDRALWMMRAEKTDRRAAVD